MKKKKSGNGSGNVIRGRFRSSRGGRPTPKREAQLTRAYESLGIDPQDVVNAPKITHILNKLPGKRGHAGIKAAIEFLRGADSDEARTFLSLWDDLESIRDVVPFEAFCVKADITTKRMLELVTGACFEQSDLATKLIAAAAHPHIVESTVKAALYHDGHQDRKMLHLNKGFLPVSKGSSATFLAPGAVQTNTQINGNNNVAVTHAVAEIGYIEKTQERIADRFNERLGMGASHPVQPSIPAEIILDAVEPEPAPDPDWGE